MSFYFRILRSTIDKCVYYCYISKGSEPTYTIDFGDGTSTVNFKENATRLGPDYPDFHYIEHLYEVPGNYVASISVVNVFGSTQIESSDEVIIQNPLGHKFILDTDLIDPVPYPDGSVTFDAQLVKNPSHSFQPSDTVLSSGWANNVHAHWILSKPGSDVLLQHSYGNYDVGKLGIHKIAIEVEQQIVANQYFIFQISMIISLGPERPKSRCFYG